MKLPYRDNFQNHLQMKKGRRTVLSLDDTREKMWVSVLELKMEQPRGSELA